MKRLLPLIAALVAFPAAAQTTGSITVGTDYVSRGTSQTYGDPSAILYIDHQFKDGVYVSAVAAYVDFDDDRTFYDGAHLEADVFAGYRFAKGKTNFEVGLAAITYHGVHPNPAFNPSGNWNMVEAHVTVSRSLGKATVTGTVGVTPDYFNNYGPSVWTDAQISYPVTKRVTLMAEVGRQQMFEPSSVGMPAALSSYTTFNVGVSYAVTPKVSVDVHYYDNDTKIDLGEIYRPRVVFSVRRTF